MYARPAARLQFTIRSALRWAAAIAILLGLYGGWQPANRAHAGATLTPNWSTLQVPAVTGDVTTKVDGTPCGANSLGHNVVNGRDAVKGYETSCNEPDEWCADFAKWVWLNAGVADTSKDLNARAASFWNYGLRHHTLSSTPAVGDAIVFSYNGRGFAAHVGIVVQVRSDGEIESIGGNEAPNWEVSFDTWYNGTIGPLTSGGLEAPARPIYDHRMKDPLTISGYVAPVGVLRASFSPPQGTASAGVHMSPKSTLGAGIAALAYDQLPNRQRTNLWLNDADFVDTQVGWTVGKSGMIAHTVNGGASWTVQASSTDVNLSGIAATSKHDAWAVGGSTILSTSDGGTNWLVQHWDPRQNLRDGAFAGAQEGWAVGDGGSILHTENGGATWKAQFSGTGFTLFDVTFTGDQNGWAVGDNGTIVHTTDGGAMWTAQASGTRQSLTGVSFSDGRHGWAVGGAGTILHTANSGATWLCQSGGTLQSLYSVAFPDSLHGWAVGGDATDDSAGTILRTTNGGATWSAQKGRTVHSPLHGVDAVDAQHAWVVSESGTILRSVAHGATGSAHNGGAWQCCTSVAAADGYRGWAAGYGSTITRITGGLTPSLGLGAVENLSGISCPSTAACVAVGPSGHILATSDGGLGWYDWSSGSAVDLHGISCPNPGTCYAVGSQGAILATTVEGRSWYQQTAYSHADLFGISCPDISSCYAVGAYGAMLSTVDGGISWQSVSPSTPNRLDGIACPSTYNCFAVGAGGTILARSRGAEWHVLQSGTGAYLRAIACLTITRCFAVGDRGTILSTVDGGHTWRANRLGSRADLRAISCAGERTCQAVGGQTLVTTDNGGVTWASRQVLGQKHLAGISCLSTGRCVLVSRNE